MQQEVSLSERKLKASVFKTSWQLPEFCHLIVQYSPNIVMDTKELLFASTSWILLAAPCKSLVLLCGRILKLRELLCANILAQRSITRLYSPRCKARSFIFFQHWHLQYQFVQCDSPGEGSSEKNCCWQLTFRQPERRSSSESSEQCLSGVFVRVK